jgi:hypothetical protein
VKVKPTLIVNLHCEEGRGMFQLDLDSFTSQELEAMTRLMGLAKGGCDFAVEPTKDGRQRMIFTLGEAMVVQ